MAALIAAELELESDISSPHPLLPPMREPKFTPAFAAELKRVAAGEPFTGGIDLSRYEPPDAPDDPEDLDAWRAVLHRAYTASVMVDQRNANLSLLNEFGKNAWLVHNAQLEDILKSLEEELMSLKTQCELVNKERKAMQLEAKPELERLERRWKTGITRVLETEMATEKLRLELLKRRKEGAPAPVDGEQEG